MKPHTVEVLFQRMVNDKRELTYQVTQREGGPGENPPQHVIYNGQDRDEASNAALKAMINAGKEQLFIVKKG